jgi:hypothetical protein
MKSPEDVIDTSMKVKTKHKTLFTFKKNSKKMFSGKSRERMPD